jgi:phosphoglycolate phosphatase
MTSSCRHVVWDWNGTLLDDAGLGVAVMNELLRQRCLPPISLAFYKALIEFPVIGYYRTLGFDFSAEPFERVSDEYVSLYQASWRGCTLQRGAQAAMKSLREAGVGQSVLSASKSEYLEEQLAFFGVRGLLDKATGADNHHGHGKGDIAREHLRALGLAPAGVLFVGDTRHDVEVAQAMGCGCVLIDFGHYARERLTGLGCPVVSSFHELSSLIPSALNKD